MNTEENHDLEETNRPLSKRIKRTIRRPRKTAPEPETLRGWAKSSIKSRNKS
jgi:hypothetical protein